MKDNRLCTKCGLLPQAGTKPEPPCKPKCACKPKKCRKDCCSDPFVFRKVVIPAALGDDITGKDKPANGAYTNAYVEYEANGSQYMYDSYGVYTKLEVKEQSGVTDFNELTGRPKYAGEIMTGDTNIPDVLSAPTFKPFPDDVVTDGTTQQFMNSILALSPTIGTAYLGTVTLSDMPAGMIQGEVEVYVYNDYTVYCIMRSTDVAPYSWWCASYNYQGWQPIGSGSGSMTIFYANSQEAGATRHIYKDDHFTEEASVQDLLDANEAGPITLRITIYPNLNGVFSDAYIQNAYVGENDYQFVFLDERTYREYAASTTADTTFYYFSNVLQTQLSAGTNIQINSNVISATDTTYNNFTGTDGIDAGAAGLVPAPATTDAGKFLKADGTWDTVSGGGIPTTATFWGESYDSVNNKVDGLLKVPEDSGIEWDDSNNTADFTAKLGTYYNHKYLWITVTPENSIQPLGSRLGVGANGFITFYSMTNTPMMTVGNNNVELNNNTKITKMKDPTAAQDAATKNYVDSLYPVGTVYTSTSSVAPTFAGGTWTSIGSQTIGSSTVYYYERTA